MSNMFNGRTCALAPMSLDYLSEHVRILSEPTVTEFLRVRQPITRQQQESWIRRAIHSDSDEMLAVLAPDGSYIGAVHLREIDSRFDRTAHSGIVIDRRYWGRGIGTEARMLQLKYAFDAALLHNLSLYAFVLDSRHGSRYGICYFRHYFLRDRARGDAWRCGG